MRGNGAIQRARVIANETGELVIMTSTNGRFRSIKFTKREAIDLRAAVIGALNSPNKTYDVSWDKETRE